MEKTTKNGIHRIRQEGGKTIAWAEESGVKVLEKDGYYFKDLAKRRTCCRMRTGVSPMRREPQTLQGVFPSRRSLALCCTHRTRPYRRCRAVRSRERLTENVSGIRQRTVCDFRSAERISGGRAHPPYPADERGKPGDFRKMEQ